MLGAPHSEKHRFALGLLFLICGILLLLWGWGSWLYRTTMHPESDLSMLALSSTMEDSADPTLPDNSSKMKAVRTLPSALMTALLLILLFLFGSYAVVRAGRRYFATAQKGRAAPTPVDDIWSMHKVKDGADDLAR